MFDCVLNMPLALDVNKVCFGEELIFLICMKNQSVTEWYRCGKCGAMHKKLECLHYHEVKAVNYFELLSMRYSDTNAVTQRD